MRKIILGTISLYQGAISPLLGPRCRFYPSCSHYAAEAVAVHGAAKGTLLGIKRLLRCHPFNSGGVDLVPERAATQSNSVGQHNTAVNHTQIKGDQAHG